jgi:hypothetical protein
MIDKINIKKIVRKHFATFQDERTGKKDVLDYIFFIFLPLLISVIFAIKFQNINSLANILIISLSIFTGLLFNLLLLTYDLVKRNDNKIIGLRKEELKTKEDDDLKIKGRLLKQIFNNISYSILISLFAVLILFLSLLWDNYYYNVILSFAIYFLTINFFLTMLMVLKRTHNLLSSEF